MAGTFLQQCLPRGNPHSQGAHILEEQGRQSIRITQVIINIMGKIDDACGEWVSFIFCKDQLRKASLITEQLSKDTKEIEEVC